MADQNFTINGGFFDSINDDRLYSADEMNKPYNRIVSDGVFATNQGTSSTDFQVMASSGMDIIVKAGQGLVGGKWVESLSDTAITVPPSTTVTSRIDSVILQVDNRMAYRVPRIVYRTGTPSVNPVAPSINTVQYVSELRLANIAVGVSVTSIRQMDITDKRGSSECPWVTGLIEQVDTSTLYEQFNDAYQRYYNNETERFNTFMEHLTEQLSVNTNIVFYESHFTSTVETATIPINISTFDEDNDVLMVFVNRLRATPGIDYTISGTNIILTNTIMPNQNVNFLVMKSLVDADAAPVVQELQAINTTLSGLTADTGWQTITLKNGASAYNVGYAPKMRKKSDTVFLTGSFKGITAVDTVIATLPSQMRPSETRFWVASTSASGIIVSLRITPTGDLSIASISGGSLASASRVSIETSYIV